MTRTAVGGAPEVVELSVGGRPARVLAAYADRPRAVLYALHGGSASKEYFDTPVDRALSLLRLGPLLGFTVIAPDRPGYGPDGPTEDALTVAERTDLLFGILGAALVGRATGAGTVLVGHSMGSLSAVRMAADPRGVNLLGVEVSGTGLARQAGADALVGRLVDRTGSREDRTALHRMIWGPPELYPAGTEEAQPPGAGPGSDGDDMLGWAAELPAIAPRVRIPVSYTLAEYEGWWEPGEGALTAVAALFTSAPFVETAVERDGGHNLSLGRTARAYHLRVAAFAEHCIARAEIAADRTRRGA